MEQHSAELRDRALMILDRVLAITHRNGLDFQPLLECQEKVRELRSAVSDSHEPNLDPNIKALAEGEHVFSKLLTLVEPSQTLDYSRRASLQKAVQQSFSEQLSMAALLGDLIVRAESVAESATHKRSNSILEGRYELQRKLQQNDADKSVFWLGYDTEYASQCLIRLWIYPDNLDKKPDNLTRASWDSELRTLYRLCSSASAEESILIMRDARIAHDERAFVMVLKSESNGYDNLATALANRSQYDWLNLDNRSQTTFREDLWRGLRRLANGIELLHKQQVIHRHIDAATVYLNPKEGPESWRLGGFEWSVRLGNEPKAVPGKGWGTPPEGLVDGYTFDTDWYAFGMLAARCFYNLEAWEKRPVEDLNGLVYKEVDQNRGGQIWPKECELIKRLIAFHPMDRLTFSNDILSSIDAIIQELETGLATDNNDKPLVVVINHRGDNTSKLLSAVCGAGFEIFDEDGKPEEYNSTIPIHVSQLKAFIRNDLRHTMLHPSNRRDIYLLEGEKLTWRIRQFEDKKNGTGATWNLAFIGGPQEGGWSSDGRQGKPLEGVSIDVVTHWDISPRLECQTWEPYLPPDDKKKALYKQLQPFDEFLRCTNQLDLLMRDAEIFCYSIIPGSEKTEDGFEYIRIKEEVRQRKLPNFIKNSPGLLEFIERELESNKPECNQVLLSNDDKLDCRENAPIRNKDNRGLWWTILYIQREEGYLELRRQFNNKRPPQSGYVRSKGHYGQIKLINRRQKAIERLPQHSYLLRSLVDTADVCMDTGTAELPYPLNPQEVDPSKIAVIENILRVRPIYALQGPPGTGKTTLVAYLLREILEEDPVAQILVTAQAHGAVDVLREKVREEAFDKDNLPLAIRLGGGEETNIADEAAEDTVEQVTHTLLKKTHDRFAALQTLSPIQKEWQDALSQLQDALQLGELDDGNLSRFLSDLQQLIKRGASITYCTTSARDLADLAEGSQLFDWSFDWSIVEEAGKAHGFDLALPLQAGHRWMLLGDQDQLPPYRYTDYEKGINELDNAVEVLKSLPDRNLLDHDWIEIWSQREEEDKKKFQAYAQKWLKTFDHIFSRLSRVQGGQERLTEIDSPHAYYAGKLTAQYRMHPLIGELISHTFYKGGISHETREPDGTPKSHVRHPFAVPTAIQDKAVVWLDVPWCQQDPDPDCEDRPYYTNIREVNVVESFLKQLCRTENQNQRLKVAVLSPYNQQRRLIEKRLEEFQRPDWLELCKNLKASRTRRQTSSIQWAHTVDSFQGNQADVIIVSLVRNNTLPQINKALGFVTETSRLNVMLSRAERLLVLVGSWDFFNKQLEPITADDLTSPLLPWRKLLDTLTEWFADGRAVKLDDTTVNSDR